MGDLGLSCRNTKFYQGYYKPINPQKYVGDSSNIIYRSGLELKFFMWADKTETVMEWGSEEIKIPYYDSVQKKMRTYFIDAYVKILEGTTISKYLIEVKPYKQTKEPTKSKGKKKSSLLYETIQYQNNCDKWHSAETFAKKNGMKFIIITEKELK